MVGRVLFVGNLHFSLKNSTQLNHNLGLMQRVLFILFTLWFTGVSAQTKLPTPSAFLKDLESDLSKGLPDQAKWKE